MGSQRGAVQAAPASRLDRIEAAARGRVNVARARQTPPPAAARR